MKKKIVSLLAVLFVVATASAQIGYKGQVSFSASVGADLTNGILGAVSIDRYFSTHSVIGIGGSYVRTRYDASGGDSFRSAQWFGNIHYRYAVPLNRFVLMPSGGVLLGGEQCDRFSKQDNFVPYKDQFIYGVFLEFSAEYILGKYWSIFLAPKLDYLMKTNFDAVKLSGSAGVKVYF